MLETLGSGGEARVVKALDHQHGRLVALKLRRVDGESGARTSCCARRGVLLDLAPHPALPLVREDFFEDDQYVIVMDWVDGTDLARLLRSKGTPGLALSSVLSLPRRSRRGADVPAHAGAAPSSTAMSSRQT